MKENRAMKHAETSYSKRDGLAEVVIAKALKWLFYASAIAAGVWIALHFS